jgi:hypothetical protein
LLVFRKQCRENPIAIGAPALPAEPVAAVKFRSSTMAAEESRPTFALGTKFVGTSCAAPDAKKQAVGYCGY